MSLPRIAIIIVNWKQPDLTIKTIKSIQQIKASNFSFQIFLINNNQADESYKRFISEYKNDKNIQIINTGANLGFSGGNNYGLKLAQKQDFDYYLLANNDIEVKSDFLFELLKFQQSKPKPCLLSPKIYFAPGYEYKKDYSASQLGKVIWSYGGNIDWKNVEASNFGIDQVDTGQFSSPLQPDFNSGCCLLIPKQILQTVGYLDDSYFMYLEDVDYSVRTVKAGFELYVLPNSIIWHLNSGSSKAASDIHNYFLTRNRLIFAFKYATFRIKMAVLRQSLQVLFSDPSKWRRQAVIDFLLHKLGKGTWQ